MNYREIQPVYTSIGVECNETDLMASIHPSKNIINSQYPIAHQFKMEHFSYSNIPLIPIINNKNLQIKLKQFSLYQSKEPQITLSRPKAIANVGSKYHQSNLKLITDNSDNKSKDLLKEKLMRISLYDLYRKTKKNSHRHSIELINNCLSDKDNNSYKTLSSIKHIQSNMSSMQIINGGDNKSVFDNLRDIGINRRKKITIDCLKNGLSLKVNNKTKKHTSQLIKF